MCRCTKCHLHKTATNVKIDSRGSENPLIMIVGEAPGKREDRLGRPFVGPAGELLDELMASVGLGEDTVLISNIVRCFPQRQHWMCAQCGRYFEHRSVLFNFLVKKFKDDAGDPLVRAKVLAADNAFHCPRGCSGVLMLADTQPIPRPPTPDEVDACLPYLYEDFARYKPEVVVAMGAPSANALRGKVEPIGKIRGRLYMIPMDGLPPLKVLPTIHTAHVLRGGAQFRSHIAADLSEARRLALKQQVHSVGYKIINDTHEAVTYLQGLREAYRRGDFKAVAFDIETVGLDLFLDKDIQTGEDTRLLGLAFCCEAGQAVFLPYKHSESEIDTGYLQEELYNLFEEVPVVPHNAVFDCYQLRSLGMYPRPYFDTLLASSVLYADKQSHALESLAVIFLGAGAWKGDIDRELAAQGIPDKYKHYGRVSLKSLGRYCCYDTESAFRLWHLLEEKLETSPYKPAFDRVMRGLPVFLNITQRGNFIDLDRLGHLHKTEYPALRAEILETIRKDPKVQEYEAQAGKKFNPNSTQQVAAVLFDAYGLPQQKKTGKGGDSTDSSVQIALYTYCEKYRMRREAELIRLLRTWKKMGKIMTSYLSTLSTKFTRRGTYNITVGYDMWSASGRFRSSDFSVHTAPAKSDVRRLFVSEWYKSGGLLLVADFSQIELRVLASVAKDPALTKVFHEGGDIHRFIASQCVNKPQDKVTPGERQAAKSVGFGVIYGRSAKTVAEETGMTVAKAETFIANLFERFVGVAKYIEDQHAFVKKHGYVVSPSDRVRYLPAAKSRERIPKAEALRQAQNFPIQSSASDMTFEAIIIADSAMRNAGLKSRVWLFHHDAIGVDVYPGELMQCYAILKWAMESEVLKHFPWFTVPLVADFELGTRWGGALSIKSIGKTSVETVPKSFSVTDTTLFLSGKLPWFKELTQFAARGCRVNAEVLETFDDKVEDDIMKPQRSYKGNQGGDVGCIGALDIIAPV